MEEYFIKFLEKISLTSNQIDDAKTKYNWVCKVLHNYFYETKYDWSTKYLFWSYKKKTNIRPIIKDQDVDVLFKLPNNLYEKYDNYKWNWQSQLLQEIRSVLAEKYTTTDNIKWWGKVILIEFTDWKHNIELLPAFENSDKIYDIPNSYDWWSWEKFNPRLEIDNFYRSNNINKWLTKKLSKILKKWLKSTPTLNLKSYKLEQYIIVFLNNYKFNDYPTTIRDFFKFLLGKIDADNISNIETALNRSNKSLKYINDWKIEQSLDEYIKIFGTFFPRSIELRKNNSKSYKAPDESFINDLFRINLVDQYDFNLSCDVEVDWFRKYWLWDFINNFIKLPKKKKLIFRIIDINIPQP